MNPIDFNALAVVLKATIEDKEHNEFTKKTFITKCSKFISSAEALRLFNALSDKQFIRRVNKFNYVFVIEPNVLTRNDLVNLFDQCKIRKPRHPRTYTDEQRAAAAERMRQKWTAKTSLKDFTTEELYEEIARREAEAQFAAKKEYLDNILQAADLTLEELKSLIAEVEQK
jgi:hypothetical protein